MTAEDPFLDLELIVEAAPRYLLGLPILVAVTYVNHADAEFLRLPQFDILSAPGGIRVDLEVASTGQPVHVAVASRRRQEKPHPLVARSSQRGLADLTNYGLSLEPGSYDLTLTLLNPGGRDRPSKAVRVELAEPTDADAAEAARLRRLAGRPDSGAWAPFLADNWNTVRAHVSTEAARQLAFHLFLHRVFYGSTPLDAIELAHVDRVTEPLLAPETALARLELLLARGDPASATERAAIAARWPAVRGSVQDIDAGQGLLALGRVAYGFDGSFAARMPTTPYAHG